MSRYDEHPHPLPVSKTKAGAAGLFAVLALATGALATNRAVVEQPEYLATAIMMPGTPVEGIDPAITATRGADVNVIAYKDRFEFTPVEAGKHDSLPEWTEKLGPLPVGKVGIARRMGWSTNYMQDVAAGRKPFTFCVDERRAFDQQHGTNTAQIGEETLRDIFRPFPRVSVAAAPCSEANLVLGASAARDCGSAQAAGCAAFNGRQTRVTFNGEQVAAGQLSMLQVKAIDIHEVKHAGDVAHEGRYSGTEPNGHSHDTDMDFLCQNGPCGNPRFPVPAIEDWQAPGGGWHWGLDPQAAPPNPTPTPPPPPTPSPTPRPTATPSPSPTPPPPPSPDQGCATARDAVLAVLASHEATYRAWLQQGFNGEVGRIRYEFALRYIANLRAYVATLCGTAGASLPEVPE